MKEVPTAKIKLTEVKELFDAGYEILGELRSEVNAPVVRAKFLNQEVIAIYGKEAAKIFYDHETLNVKEQCLNSSVQLY